MYTQKQDFDIKLKKNNKLLIYYYTLENKL